MCNCWNEEQSTEGHIYIMKIVLLLVTCKSYYVGLKLGFHLKFWDFFPWEMQKIILHEIIYNPCKISYPY